MQQRRMRQRRTDSAEASRSPNRECLRLFVAWLATAILSGCSAFQRDEETGMFGMTKFPGISSVKGPLERALYNEESPLEMGRKFSPEERRQLELCRSAFESGNYDEAIKLSKKATKKFKESTLGEEAQFYLAESYFAQGKYAKAQDSYDQLFEDYPSTRYVEPATRRLFFIGKEWLQIAEPVAKTEIMQVSGEKVVEDNSEPPEMPRDPTLRVPLLPNFHDRSRPIFDTQGNALRSLKSIWMNDPTGPLADDALMLTATYYQRHQNYVEADRYFEILREEYPDSPHLESAFVLGAHVKQMSYQGPYYEGQDLEGARKLKEQSLQLFPVSSHRQQLRKDLDELYLQEAERHWAKVEYAQKKGKPKFVAIECIKLIAEYPDTGYAKEARRILMEIDRKELQGLPEVMEFIETLPANEPLPSLDRGGEPVKAVSDPGTSGRVRL